jgi:hypothetical protein
MRVRLVIGTAAMIGGSVMAFGSPAVAAGTGATSARAAEVGAAQTCSGTRYIYLPDQANRVVSMSYIECWRTYNGTKQSSTEMWLWDNKEGDGLCATGTVRIGDWSHSWSWCDATKHSPKFISGWHNGADAKVTLVTG